MRFILTFCLSLFSLFTFGQSDSIRLYLQVSTFNDNSIIENNLLSLYQVNYINDLDSCTLDTTYTLFWEGNQEVYEYYEGVDSDIYTANVTLEENNVYEFRINHDTLPTEFAIYPYISFQVWEGGQDVIDEINDSLVGDSTFWVGGEWPLERLYLFPETGLDIFTAYTLGCLESNASNYNASATTDDESCCGFMDECGIIDGDGSSCADACGVPNGDDSLCSGCTNQNASNFDSTALIDDGSCIISGCLWYLADNYNPEASEYSTCTISIPGSLEFFLYERGYDDELDGVVDLELYTIDIYGLDDLPTSEQLSIISSLELISPWISYLEISRYNDNEMVIPQLILSNNYFSLYHVDISGNILVNSLVLGSLPLLEQVNVNVLEISLLDIMDLGPNTSITVNMQCSSENFGSLCVGPLCVMLSDSFDLNQLNIEHNNIFYNTTGVSCAEFECENVNACNYSPNSVNNDDVFCDFPSEFVDCDGICIDTSACNYLLGASFSCVYANLGEDCNGNCVNGEYEGYSEDPGASNCIIPGCTDCQAVNFYDSELYCEQINFDDGSCIYPDIGNSPFSDNTCENILNWSSQWMINTNTLFTDDIYAQGSASPFSHALGFEVSVDECLNLATIAFNPPANWPEISLDILNASGDEIVATLLPEDSYEMPISSPIEDVWELYSECLPCSTLVDPSSPHLVVKMRLNIPVTCNTSDNDWLLQEYPTCPSPSEECLISFDGGQLSLGVSYMNSWLDEADNDSDDHDEMPSEAGCYYVTVNESGNNVLKWDNLGLDELDDVSIIISRRSVNYEDGWNSGWEQIHEADVSDFSYEDTDTLYRHFPARYSMRGVQSSYDFCNDSVITTTLWESNTGMISNHLMVSHNQSSSVNLMWTSQDNGQTLYNKILRRPYGEEDFAWYVDLPSYVTSFTDKYPLYGVSEYVIERVGRFCYGDAVSPLSLSNVVVHQDLYGSICGPGMVWSPETLACVLLNECPSCIGDLDNNNNVGTTDLLLFLVVFGDNCE